MGGRHLPSGGRFTFKVEVSGRCLGSKNVAVTMLAGDISGLSHMLDEMILW